MSIFFKFMTTSWEDVIFDTLTHYFTKRDLKRKEKEIKKLKELGYRGNPNDYDAILKYEQRIENLPMFSVCISHDNSHYTFIHYYDDGNKVVISVTLRGL